MTNLARLIETRTPRRPEGLVLVLHGGASRRESMMVSPTQLSVLRMIPVAHAVDRAARGRLAVVRLLNSTRGWDTQHTPADDATWALEQLRSRFGTDLPTCLVGHSLGGRAALLAAEHPMVDSAVALNPWVYPSDGNDLDLRGRRLLVVHGDQDRIARPERAAQVADNLRRRADLVGFVRVRGGKHAMLRHGRTFERIAAGFVVTTLLGVDARAPVSDVLAGESLVEV